MKHLLECGPGANAFIEKYLMDCVYTTRDIVGFSFGMTSIAVWVVAQVPQFVSNVKNQSAEALSAWFLTNWLLGDTCNLLGCLLQGEQLPTTTYTAMYFILADAVMMIQYIYYHALQKRKERLALQRARHHHRRRHKHHALPMSADAASPADHTTLTLEPAPSQPAAGATSRLVTQTLATTSAALLLVTLITYFSSSLPPLTTPTQPLPSYIATLDHPNLSNPSRSLRYNPLPTHPSSQPPADALAHSKHKPATIQHWWGDEDWEYAAGTTLGWVSSALYLMSRVSQIVKNHQRQSSEGLSLAMFACAVSANLCTGTSILLRAASLSDLLYTQGPWIIGSMGVISLDLVIFSQAIWFGALHKREAAGAAAALEAPLLGAAGAAAGGRA